MGSAWQRAQDEQTTLHHSYEEGPEVLNPIDEAPWVGTNDAAQWGLAAIQVSALAGKHMQ